MRFGCTTHGLMRPRPNMCTAVTYKICAIYLDVPVVVLEVWLNIRYTVRGYMSLCKVKK